MKYIFETLVSGHLANKFHNCFYLTANTRKIFNHMTLVCTDLY